MSFEIGTVVKALKGKDKQKFFCVVGCDNDYVFICDGKSRTLEKPKRKKIKHIKELQIKLQTEDLQVNKHLYRAIKRLVNFEEE